MLHRHGFLHNCVYNYIVKLYASELGSDVKALQAMGSEEIRLVSLSDTSKGYVT